MERTIFLGSDRTTFEVGSLWAVRSFRLVGPKCPFRLTRLLYDPEYRPFVSCSQEQQPNVRWLGSGLCDGDVTFHWVHRWSSEIFTPEFLLNGKSPCSLYLVTYFWNGRRFFNMLFLAENRGLLIRFQPNMPTITGSTFVRPFVIDSLTLYCA